MTFITIAIAIAITTANDISAATVNPQPFKNPPRTLQEHLPLQHDSFSNMEKSLAIFLIIMGLLVGSSLTWSLWAIFYRAERFNPVLALYPGRAQRRAADGEA